MADLRSFDLDLTGKRAQEACDSAGISLNKNQFPYDPRSAFQTSGLRIGTAAVTTQGMTEAEMPLIASLIREAVRHRDDASALATVREEVASLCGKFVPYP